MTAGTGVPTERLGSGKWLRWLAIGIAVVAAMYFVVGGIGTAVVMDFLLTPGRVDWAGVNNPDPPKDPFELGYRGDPQVALGLPFETVSYETELGPAEAWFVPAANMAGPWAIYVHGIGGLRENGYRQLSILHEAGVPTLMITYRNDAGAPAEQNAMFSFGVDEWHDLDSAVTWVNGRGAAGVILAGESMGGAIVGQFLMHSEQTDKVAGLALDAPALDLHAVLSDLIGARGLPFAGTLAGAGVSLVDWYRGARLSEAVSFDAVADFDRPLFLAHGASDALVPVGISDRLVGERAAETTYVRTNANHLRSFNEDPARYRSEMLGWLGSLGAGRL